MSEGASSSGDQHRQQEQPSAEDVRRYLEQLRGVPCEQILTETLSGTLTAAQAKLGRHDARLLIDTAGLVFTHAKSYLNNATASQFEQVLNQLRMAQVQAEQRAGSQAEENDLPQAPAPPAAGTPSAGAPPAGGAAAASTPSAPQQPSPASKLWVPGRP
ncbi:hypothetical protein [Phytoactinopolyspora halotolerans]|uniref:Uncharacterized protein n=1 Tax=Phytoactinopolyspora halotolerans TaxID=1981512 RepID=A0A6L9S9V2_9ACTN|nr:hypothetical protein [Phytoactinopolyspora halotolerans]NEE01308.1 hypothetical protein [Phytoactinopolyspora halotolerans]